MEVQESHLLWTDVFLRWLNPLFEISGKRPLTQRDLGQSPEYYDIEHQTKRLWEAWYLEVDVSKNENREPSLKFALWNCFKSELIRSAIFQFWFMLFQLGLPFLVGELVEYIKTGEGGRTRGLLLVLGFFLLSVGSSILISTTLDYLRRLGVCMRSTCMMLVYEQALSLHSSERSMNSIGQTTNLMAIDAEKLNIAMHFIHFLWHGPIIGLIIMIILIFEIGYGPALAGMAFLFILFPLQNYLAATIGNIRRSLIRYTDERVKLINEALQSIRIIKFYSWEQPLEKRITDVRVGELTLLRRYLDAAARLRELMFASQPIAALVMVTIGTFAMNKPLGMVKIFKVLAFLNITRLPLNLLGQALKNYSDALVSIFRINKFLVQRTVTFKQRKMADYPKIVLDNASFAWQVQHGQNDPGKVFNLRNLQFSTLSSNELIAVIGSVGSGKSSLLSSLLGETILEDGELSIFGTISYCSQTPWIQNLSLRQNVLFGCDEGKIVQDIDQNYFASIEAAGLIPDLRVLPEGDNTQIGERGVNLSGGQKARVALARAFYSKFRSQIYFFDDPFSALDGNTGNLVFQKGIRRMLHDKLRIVALNSHLHLLKYFDRILVLEDGEIAGDGSLAKLFDENPTLMQRVTGMHSLPPEDNAISQDDIAYLLDVNQGLDGVHQVVRKEEFENERKETVDVKMKVVNQSASIGGLWSAYLKYFSSAMVNVESIQVTKFYETELMQQFSVKLLGLGIVIIFILLVIFSSAQFFRVAVDYCIVEFSESAELYWERLYYSSFGILIMLLLLRSLILNACAIRSSSVLHAAILRTILSAPVITFFDVNTVGAILNRFAKDMEIVEVNIPEFLLQLIINWFQVFSVFGLCIWASPWFALIVIPLGYGFYKVYTSFSGTSRDLKRMESASRSPLYASLSETLTGLEIIRAFGDRDRFLNVHMKKMSNNHNLMMYFFFCTSWMTIRLELFTAFILSAVGLLAVCLREVVSPISLGLALSYGLQLTALFQRCLQLVIEIQTYMTSTERVLEYLEIAPEPNIVNKNVQKEVSSFWPETGSIQFQDVVMQYRENPPVLRGMNATIRGGERIGICGRTGAGKSSLMMALFRFVNLTHGNIKIDGIDIGSVPLIKLRSNIAIIPQDPVLFTGDIRFQLDPFGQFDDIALWNVLELVNMKSVVTTLPKGMNELISEGGDNMSQGQKQLLCIARALLRDAKILVIDEGTSAVDPHTDGMIQTVLQKQAKARGLTILAIAHRLQTIIDFDRIIVMRDGIIAEFDDPKTLLSEPSSIFYSMMQE